MASAVTSKGQVTIPKAVRDLLDLRPGHLVEFERAPDGTIVLKKVGAPGQSQSRFARFRGHAGKRMTTEELMALTRGER
jgi:AbrB family looped-hinge helix DNA binding protein